MVTEVARDLRVDHKVVETLRLSLHPQGLKTVPRSTAPQDQVCACLVCVEVRLPGVLVLQRLVRHVGPVHDLRLHLPRAIWQEGAPGNLDRQLRLRKEGQVWPR